VDDLEEALEEIGQTNTILLDFSKAFDKMPHQRLLHKLHFYGVQGQTLRWVEAFLSHRTQQVAVEGKMSEKGQVTSGVPQESVFGPTIFLVYINDIGRGIKSSVKLIANDTMLYWRIRNQSDTLILRDGIAQLGDGRKDGRWI